MAIKVLLVEDTEMARQGIRARLEGNPDINLITGATDCTAAMNVMGRDSADVVLMDFNMPGKNGIECTKLFRQLYPTVKLLLLSINEQENFLFDIHNAGVDGCIMMNSSKEELNFSIRKIANGGKYYGSEFAVKLLSKYKTNPRSDSFGVDLSDREKDVLALIAEGYTNAEIAEKLFTSIRTIETRRKRLLEKTGTTNTATLIRFAVKNGLVS